jgi:hypothetical protein
MPNIEANQHRERRLLIWPVVVLAVIATASLAFIYGRHLPQGKPIRSDGMGYYLYLPAVFLDHDVTMERTLERSYAETLEMRQINCCQESGIVASVRRVAPHQYYLDKYAIGEAIMLVPFFVGGDVLAYATGSTRNGFSWPYQAAAAAGGLTYALLGLLVLGIFLQRWFSRRTVVITLFALALGTNLLHYATYDAVSSHAFAFFLVAALLELTFLLGERPRPVTAVAFGGAAGLLAAVRPTDIVVLVVPALIGIGRLRVMSHRTRVLRAHLPLFALGAGVFVAAVLPQLAYWHAITGKWYVYPYGGEHLELLHPHLLDVLFSVRKGLFFWTPLLLLAVVGLALLTRFAPGVVLPVACYLLIQAWVVSSWNTWWYGGSFGQRPFVESLPAFALGLAAIVETARSQRSKRMVQIGIVTTTLMALHAMVGYWEGVIPFDGTDWHTYVRSFGHL